MKIGHDNDNQYVPNKPLKRSILQKYMNGANSESTDFIFNRQLSARGNNQKPPRTVFHKKMKSNSVSTLDGVLKFKSCKQNIPVDLDNTFT